MPSQPDYYAVLEVSPSASPEVITSAYRSLARKYHPDANPSSEANAKMKALNAAHDVLSDRHKRAAYDRQRAAATAKPAPPQTPPPPAQKVAQAQAAPSPATTAPELTHLQRIGAFLASPAFGVFVIAFIIAYVAATILANAIAPMLAEEWLVLLAVLAALIATLLLRRAPRR